MSAALAPARPRPSRAWPSVDAEPFLRLLDAWGGAQALGVQQHSAEERAIERARRDGHLTVWAADRLAAKVLRVSACEVWGAAFYDA